MREQGADAFAPWQGEDGRQRGFRRWSVHVRATLRQGRRRRICIADDLSPGGASVSVFRTLDASVGDAVRLVLPGYGAIPAEVRHVGERRFGLMFTHDDQRALSLARFLVAQPPPRKVLREALDIPARLLVRGRSEPCILSDISRFGACVRFDNGPALDPEEEVLLRIDGVGSLEAIVTRVGVGEFGLVLIDEYTGGARSPADRDA